MHVLFEDNHLLIVMKAAGLATQGALPGSPSLVEQCRQYLKRKYQKPGNVYLGVVSRLDAPVTGAVLFARTSKAAARLTEQLRGRRVEKTYWAVVEGSLAADDGLWVDWLWHDDAARRVRVVDSRKAGAQEARLRFRRLQNLKAACLVEIGLETGRKHQIRVQFASRRHPIVGDARYGATVGFGAGIALHSRRLRLEHPVRHEPIEVVAPLPPTWRELGIDG